jgi:tungstate transport system ATP-binding protein
MDEPTANVDAASAQLIKEAALKARKEWGTTLVVASHDWHWLYEVCDEILYVFKGKIFGTGRETLMFGPWVPLAAGKWGKRLSDRQLLWVPRPPHNDAAAVIDTFVIAENNSPIANNGEVLQGTVSQLSLERKTGQIWATIMVGDLPFAIGLTPQQTQSRTIFPGKAVYIHYRPDKVKWI